jgi:uncharacterized protein involved in outer membrane biogenesis
VPLLALAACELAQWPFLRGPMERAASRALDRDVGIGSGFRLRLLGAVRLRADSLVLGPPRAMPPAAPATGLRPGRFLDAQGVELVLPYSSVLALTRPNRTEPLHVRLLHIRQMDLDLFRLENGTPNWRLRRAPAASDGTLPETPDFDRLVVETGRVRLHDAMNQLALRVDFSTREGSADSGAAPAAADGGRAAGAAASATPARAPAASGAAAASGPREPPGPSGSSGLSASAAGTFRGSPLQAGLTASGLIPLATSGADAPPVPFRLQGRVGRTELSLEGSARDLWHLAGLDSRFRLAGPSMASVGDALRLTLPTTPPFAAHGRLGKDGTTWSAVVEQLSVGSSRLHGDFRYVMQRASGKLSMQRPTGQLSGTLGGKRLALRDLGPAFGAPTAAVPSPRPAGRVLPQREFDLPSLGRMQTELNVRIDQVDLGTPQLAPLEPLQGTLVLRDKVLSVRDLLARNSGGTVRGALVLDAREDPPRWEADLHWAGVRLQQLVQARNRTARETPATRPAGNTRVARGPAASPRSGSTPATPAPDKPGANRPPDDAAGNDGVQDGADAPADARTFVGGFLNGQAKLQGRGRSSAAMLASLDGTVRLWVREGHISHLVVELLGIDLAESLGLLIRGDEALPLRCGLGQLTAQNGRLRVDAGVLDTEDTTLLIGGEISLVQELLALQVRAQPKDFSPLALRAPLRIEGSFADPKVRLDTPRLGARVAAAAGLAAAAPLAGLLALLDLGEPERAVCEQAWQRMQGTGQKKPEQPPRKPAGPPQVRR